MFLAFNAFMGVWFFYALTIASETRGEGINAEAQAAAAITTGVLLWLWPIGSLILGLIVALTRRKTVNATAKLNRHPSASQPPPPC
jgi:cytochrome c-type biogenesis protein CcmH/NrfF